MKRAQQPPPIFSARVCCGHGRPSQLLLNFCLNKSHVLQINSLFKRAFKCEYVKSVYNLEHFLQDYDDILFSKETHENHTMHYLLPSSKSTCYNLWSLGHGLLASRVRSELHKKTFIINGVLLWSLYEKGQTIIFWRCGFFFLWSPYVIGRPYIFSSCNFYLLFFLRLISAAADWMSTILLHMVWP